ncbi:MAG: cysteine--tRNA ligase, partial [Oscillospiraceae bacterium]|nr:cysteine--tRNA ligase [Oscillospiraceae bacterium]
GAVDEAARAEYCDKFKKQMDNDLNTSMGVTVLYDVLKAKCNDVTKRAILADLDSVLSLDLIKKADALREKNAKAAAQSAGEFTVIAEDGTADEAIEAMIRARAEAKKAKNFAEADRLRDELKAQGVEVIDIPNGAKWKRV